MSFHWIDPEKYSFNSLLLMDRFLIRQIMIPDGEEYARNLGTALANHPAVAWYFREKAPETAGEVERLIAAAPQNCSLEQVRAAERFVLDRHDWAVVYIYPEAMEKSCPYIRDWDPARLFELADFRGKLVLDVGAGTGRLAFAAAKQARQVYASEPVDRLREYMRARIAREGIGNVKVLDGVCECLPYEDNTFDIVMSGHVVGDDYDRELGELERVTKPGGWVLNCPGEDDREACPDQEQTGRGYECCPYPGKSGVTVYRYRKRV